MGTNHNFIFIHINVRKRQGCNVKSLKFLLMFPLSLHYTGPRFVFNLLYEMPAIFVFIWLVDRPLVFVFTWLIARSPVFVLAWLVDRPLVFLFTWLIVRPVFVLQTSRLCVYFVDSQATSLCVTDLSSLCLLCWYSGHQSFVKFGW